ncbi:MAG: hypothetical protein MRJ92_05775 [Nitrospira sp.]|nr:hypothetical protein [Nitrospira sp.]
MRACLEEVGLFDESLFVHEDWDLWIRLGSVYPFAHLARTTAEFTWRTDGTSMTSRDHEAFCRTTGLFIENTFPTSPPIRRCSKHNDITARLKGRRPRDHLRLLGIVVWNNAALTQQCPLQALAEVTDGASYEVVVVDNGSTDGVETFLRNLGGDVQVIETSRTSASPRPAIQRRTRGAVNS